MNNGKISRGNTFHAALVSHSPASAPDPASHRTAHGNFKGALFEYSTLNILMRRGPTGRMPLRNAGSGKRNVGAKGPRRGVAVTEVDFMQNEDEHVIEESAFDKLSVRFKSFQNEDDQNSSGGTGDERRFERLFQMPSNDTVGIDSNKAAFATPQARQSAVAATPLPTMKTLGDVVKFIHACVDKDPSGKSVSQILRRINAAILRQEINLPVITKVADARNVLIEVFGVGNLARDGLNPSLRNVYLMLPLWLVNLGRQRTSEQRVQAAGRVSSQRAALDSK